jgi:hypothetical protein
VTDHGLGTATLDAYPLWYASYQQQWPPVPPQWQEITAWQHSDNAIVPGVAGIVDESYTTLTINELKALGRPAPVRHVEDAHIAPDQRRQLAHALIVRPQRPADAEQVRPEPEGVPALDRAGGFDPADGRDSCGRRPRLDRGRLARSVRLARPKRDRAPIGHEERVVGVDEIRVADLGVERVDRRPERGEQIHERVVLALGDREVDGV